MRESKLNEVSQRLNQEKKNLIADLPAHLQDDFAKEGFISGGCIYSLYNGKEPKDYDFFVRTQSLADRLREFYMSLVVQDTSDDKHKKEKNIFIVHYKGQRVVITKNAISIGKKYQIITKFFGAPKEVVTEFDFKHNMFYHQNDRINTLSDWEYLDSNSLAYNEQRARDISGTIIRVHKFCERGMTITNAEMSKMLRKLRDIGFTARENEIIENVGSY
ncbi:hypothetical protein OB446_026835 [Paenibacillus alvei]|uniref:hypothetical protein n=2 Tax=Paenibacillus alvei TaxID=44250 RepID=UPI000289206E|nr:hypothetical protein [Paenibacillus alvei]EJW14106.1 hypothetical protein PAV_141p02120 [Paenibacillus alvei DSM 29]MCY9707745.1 hypothetical protein [Paenibacillus alvei]MEC0082742.1 hypothetical protein [Paenibacillus alvei]